MLALALVSAAVVAQPVSVGDDRGRTVALPRPAQRIVTLAPGLTELAYAAGAGGRLVGAARFSDFPAAARKITRVGDATRVDFERIVFLAPDLIVAWRSGNSAADVERLEQLGYPVYVSEPRRLEHIARSLRGLGALAGTAQEAEIAAAGFERAIEGLRRRHETASPVRVFYEMWRKPLMTVNGAHLISDVIALCGGINVFRDARPFTPTVSPEALLAARPEAVLGGSRPGGDEDYAQAWRTQAVTPLREVPAFYVDPDHIQRATPRVAEGAKAVCGALEQVRRAKSRTKPPGHREKQSRSNTPATIHDHVSGSPPPRIAARRAVRSAR
jgi:iron complex transport system substrate-binding protein